MTAGPPYDPAAQESAALPFPGVALNAVGVGGILGVALATVEAALVFTALTAETLKKYMVPLVSPETVAEVAALIPSANVDQVDSSVEYSIK